MSNAKNRERKLIRHSSPSDPNVNQSVNLQPSSTRETQSSLIHFLPPRSEFGVTENFGAVGGNFEQELAPSTESRVIETTPVKEIQRTKVCQGGDLVPGSVAISGVEAKHRAEAIPCSEADQGVIRNNEDVSCNEEVQCVQAIPRAVTSTDSNPKTGAIPMERIVERFSQANISQPPAKPEQTTSDENFYTEILTSRNMIALILYSLSTVPIVQRCEHLHKQ